MIQKNEELSKHTTFKIGGKTEIFIPESRDELLEIIDKFQSEGIKYKILGGGSNVLISDKELDFKVIKTTKACKDIKIEGNTVEVGASFYLPKFVRKIVENGLGGIEYLSSVPGTVGGAIYMNAGRGKKHNKQISDYLVDVEVYDGEKVKTIGENEIEFGYRYSSFQNKSDWIILSAKFNFNSQSIEYGKEKIKERMETVSGNVRSMPNAGSVFKSGRKLPLKGLKIGSAKFVSSNRICNTGNASFSDVYRLIKIAILLHKIVPFLESPELEIEMWK